MYRYKEEDESDSKIIEEKQTEEVYDSYVYLKFKL